MVQRDRLVDRRKTTLRIGLVIICFAQLNLAVMSAPSLTVILAVAEQSQERAGPVFRSGKDGARFHLGDPGKVVRNILKPLEPIGQKQGPRRRL